MAIYFLLFHIFSVLGYKYKYCRNICECADSAEGCGSALKDWHMSIKPTF